MKKVLLVFLMLFAVIYPISVDAATVDFSGYYCDAKQDLGDGTFYMTCHIVVTSTKEINKVEELCGHALDGTWIASCTGEFQSGNNTFLYNIDGVDDNYVMFSINVLDENKTIVSGVGMYGTIQELFYGFCRGIAKIEYDESIKLLSYYKI